MSDNYEFSKSTLPQGVENETPYINKQWNYINDINGGVYSNNGLTLVQFDLSSIYNSTALTDASQMFAVVPVTLVNTYTTNNTTGALVAPISNSWASVGMKSGNWNLLNGADLVVNGKTQEQYQPNINAYIQWKMYSQMSQDDLNSFGMTLGMGTKLDNYQSQKFNGSQNISSTTTSSAYPTGVIANLIGNNTYGGNGLSNNIPFPIGNNANGGDMYQQGQQFSNVYNQGLYSRLTKFVDITNGQATNLYSTTAAQGINSSANINKEFKPSYQVLNTNYSVWYDYAVIRLGDVFDCIKSFPLAKKWDATLRIYFNTGAVASVCNGSSGVMISSGSTTTFTSTCPIIQSSLNTLPASSTGQVSGLFICNATSTNLFGGVNLALSGAQNPMNSCRIYYPQITLKPEKLIPYIRENRNKKITYTSVLTNQFNAITAGSSFSALVQSGVRNPRGILIIPLISSAVNGLASTSATFLTTGITPFSQLLSPFDTCPATTNPVSLVNLQVMLGGLNQLYSTLNFNFENFIEQVSLYEKINQSDLGLSCGLINQAFWENGYRVYYVDLSRGNNADQLTPRNVNISFTNNSLQTIDILVFTEYFTEKIVDCETGIISDV